MRYAGRLALIIVFLITVHGSIVRADDMAYGETSLGFEWGTLDLNTGVFTSVGPTYLDVLALGGLGVENGNYYATGWSSSFPDSWNSVAQINPSSGRIVPGTYQVLTLGQAIEGQPPNQQYNVETGRLGSNASSLYFFVINENNGTPQLYAMNGSTGAVTNVSTLQLPASASLYTLSVNADSSAMYALAANKSVTPDFQLYGINPATGAATLIGNTSIAAQTSSTTALLFEDGTLWATVNSAEYTLNTTTGADTFVTDLTLPLAYDETDYIGGLAPYVTPTAPPPPPPPSGVPEPSTWSITLLGAAAAALFWPKVLRLRRQTL